MVGHSNNINWCASCPTVHCCRAGLRKNNTGHSLTHWLSHLTTSLVIWPSHSRVRHCLLFVFVSAGVALWRLRVCGAALPNFTRLRCVSASVCVFYIRNFHLIFFYLGFQFFAGLCSNLPSLSHSHSPSCSFFSLARKKVWRRNQKTRNQNKVKIKEVARKKLGNSSWKCN